MKRALPALLLAALSQGCATLHPPAPPQPDPVTLPALDAPAPAAIEQWWTAFGDARLDALVEEALAHNLDLRQASARLAQARARYRLARADRYPDLDLSASVTRNRASQIGPNPLPPGFAASTTGYRTSLDLSWEVDVWGRVAAATRGAAANYHASRADTAGARASLAATLARAWFQLRALDAEITLAEQILAGREQSLELIERRNREGANGQLELAQARAERDTARASLPPLRQARAQAESAIAVLLGRTPQAVFDPVLERGKALDELDNVPEVPAGLDSGLLARRPDVIAAASRLLASDWQVRSAQAAFFPRLTLTGLLGYESGELADLITAPARIGQLALAAVQPISGLASLGALRDAAAAQQAENELAYQGAVLNAFRETHDALVGVRESATLSSVQNDRYENLAEAARLARLRFDSGYSGYLEVLDSERGRDTAATAKIAARRDHLLAVVDLYLALGGGWSTLPEAAPAARQEPPVSSVTDSH